jgi:sugar lactone lactonase YvrE
VSEPRILATGLQIGESPRWHDERLWVCNWGAQEIWTLDLDGRREVVTRVPTTIPFCIDWTPCGRLLIVSGPEALVLRHEPDGSLVTHADLAAVSDGTWNEIVVDRRGNAYVNGAGFDLMDGGAFAPGVIALVRPEGPPQPVADGLEFPNGMTVTSDDSTLIVAESYGRRLTAFTIDDDGRLRDRRVWADLGDGVPDGICIDREGAIWYADVPNQRCVRVREGGEVLQSLELDRGCFACALGGDGGTTLFMVTAKWLGAARMFDEPGTGQVLCAKAPAPAAGWPGRPAMPAA